MTQSRSSVVWGLSALALLLLYAPLIALCILSFNDARVSVRWDGWSLRWYTQLWHDQPLWTALWVSLKVGVWSTAVATVVGAAAALGLEQRHLWGRGAGRDEGWMHHIGDTLMLLPLVMPELILGVAFMLCFALLKVPLGLSTVTVAHAVFNAPLVMVLVRARLRKVDPTLLEAAADLGATTTQAVRYVLLPLMTPVLLGAALLAVAVSLDDFLVTFFTTGPGATTLPLRIYSNIRSGITPELDALSTVMVLATVLVVVVALRMQRERV
ncbi:MAG: ABC transporter permease [Nitrospiraceae bacterium]